MNLGKEAARRGYSMEAELKMRVTETQDAFITEKVLPYCEQETGAEIKKSDLKDMLMKNTPAMVLGYGECSRCGLDLTEGSYGYGFGLEYCPRCGQKAKWPLSTEQPKGGENK